MATKAHMYDGVQWYQRPPVGIDDADLGIRDVCAESGGTSAGIANRFISMKASDDTLWVLAGYVYTYGYSWKAKLFSIQNNGTVGMVWLNWDYSGAIVDDVGQTEIQEMSNGDILIKGNKRTVLVPTYVIPKSTALNNGQKGGIVTTSGLKTFPYGYILKVYQDQYVWIGSYNETKLYNYASGNQIASEGFLFFNETGNACLSKYNVQSLGNVGGILYGVTVGYVSICYYNGVAIQKVATNYDSRIENVKIVKEDKWGDLVGMTLANPSVLHKFKITWNGTTPTYTYIGNITLGSQCFTFDTNADGDYFYSNAGGTWRIPANTQQGQAFSAIGNHVKIRNVGMTTYNNSLTGYFPATKQ